MSSRLDLDGESAGKLLSTLLGSKGLAATVDVTADAVILKFQRPFLIGLMSFRGEVCLSGVKETERRCILSLQPLNASLKGLQCLWQGGRRLKRLLTEPKPVELLPGVNLTPDSLAVDLDDLQRADLPASARWLVQRVRITAFAAPGADGAAITVGFKLEE